MNFINYCLIAIGDTDGVILEVEKIAETKPNVLNGGGLFVATFKSALTVREITEWMKTNERSFMVFELDKNTSGYHITKQKVNDGLFGFLKSEERIKTLFANANEGQPIKREKIKTKNIEPEFKLTESDVEKMSSKEKQEMINKIIDGGVEKMTENDKKLLSLLTK